MLSMSCAKFCFLHKRLFLQKQLFLHLLVLTLTLIVVTAAVFIRYQYGRVFVGTGDFLYRRAVCWNYFHVVVALTKELCTVG